MFIKKLLANFVFVATLLASSATAADNKELLGTITDISGTKYDVYGTKDGLKFSGIDNKVILVEFFGHRCPPCLMSIPHLIKLQEKYKKDLRIFAMEIDGFSPQALKEFGDYMEINYTLLSVYQNRWFFKYIAQEAQWRGSIPFMLLIDKKGTVRSIRIGLLQKKEMNKEIETLIREKSK